MAARRSTPIGSYEDLVARHHDAVWRSARRVLRSDDDALDVAQEVYLRLVDGRLELESGTDPRRVLCWWSIRIALNERRGADRRRRREGAKNMADERRSESADVPATAEELEEQERCERLWAHVEAMPDELRVPLVLRFAEGLGFARIAEAVGVAESTAHERVERGLAQLRRTLQGAGLAVLAFDLEGAIARSAPGAAPKYVAPSLLALRGGGVTATSGAGSVLPAWILGAVVAFVGGVLAFAWLEPESDGAGNRSVAALGGLDEPTEDVATEEDRVRSVPGAEATGDATRSNARSALLGEPMTDDQPADDEVPAHFGHVHGRVVDPVNGPLADCTVEVHSVERGGKLAAYRARATTDADGRFEARVELADANGGHYVVQATHQGFAVVRGGPIHVAAAATTDLGVLHAQAGARLREGPFSLDVLVVGADGAAVPGASVTLRSVVSLPVEAGTRWTGWTNVGTELVRVDERLVADASGRARIEGEGLGSKQLLVEPPTTELAPRALRFDVGLSDGLELVVSLDPAVRIAGTLGLVDGASAGEGLEGVGVHVVDAVTNRWIHARVEPDGRFVLEGLRAAVHRVRFGPGGRHGSGLAVSPAQLDVAAPDEDVRVVLKLRDDPRDVGLHDAEVHGRLVSARDGSPIPADPFDTEVDRVEVPAGVDLATDWLPNHMFARPVQRMLTEPIPVSGDFHHVGLAAGTYLVRSLTENHARAVIGPLTLGEREILADVELVLDAGATVAGTVTGPDGAPVDGAFVLVTGVGPYSDALIERADAEYRQADGRGFFHVNGTGRRTSDGRFELPNLPSSCAWRLAAVHPDHAPALGPVVEVAAGEVRRDVGLVLGARR